MALEEAYQKTIDYSPPTQLSSWTSITDGIQFLQSKLNIQNDIAKEKIQVVAHYLSILFEECQNTVEFPIAMTHGDFTPWNMYETKEKIHVYDWEMSTLDQPLLFDLFHYVFQTNILILQNGFPEIKSNLEQIKKETTVQKMMEQYAINWNRHYNYYLLYIVTYYAPLYIQQKDLHVQAHWLIDCWIAALADVVMKTEKIPSFGVTK